MRREPHKPDAACVDHHEADWLRRAYEEWDEEVNGEEKREFFASYQSAVQEAWDRRA